VYLKHSMEARIGFLLLLRPTNMAFSTRIISSTTNMTTSFTLGRIITWTTVAINLKPDLATSLPMPDLDWLAVTPSVIDKSDVDQS